MINAEYAAGALTGAFLGVLMTALVGFLIQSAHEAQCEVAACEQRHCVTGARILVEGKCLCVVEAVP